MDTRQLAALVAVVDRASFSQAAEQLGVTQPAVSLAIRALEKRLGATLLDRSGRTVQPTEAGRAVYRHAQRILGAEDDLLRALDEGSSDVSGQLSLGVSSGPAERLLPALLGAFRERHPEVHVALRVDDTDSVIALVVERQIELGVVGAERPHRSLLFEPFLHDELVLCVPAGHPFAGRVISLDELRTAPLVVQQEGSGVRAVMERELRRVGVRPRDLNIVAELGLTESTKAAVEAGIGVCFISRLSLEREAAGGLVASATVDGVRSSRTLFAVRLVNRPSTRTTQAFLEFARAELGDRAAPVGEGPPGPVRGGRVG
jgi:DNA-binding transcriptional LysR family regulator